MVVSIFIHVIHALVSLVSHLLRDLAVDSEHF